MRKDLTEDEMRDYIEHLERRIYYMDILLKSLHEEVKDFGKIASDLSKAVNMDNDAYAEEFTKEYIKDHPDNPDFKLDPNSSYAGKTGNAMAASSLILIKLNSYNSTYGSMERDVEFLEEYCKKYEDQ